MDIEDSKLDITITHQYGRRDEGEARVLHSSIGEGGREDEKVIGTPDVGTNYLLSHCQDTTSLKGNKLISLCTCMHITCM